MSEKSCTFARNFCVRHKKTTTRMAKPTDILQTIARYRELGIEEQIDYKNRYINSLVANSVALSVDSEHENYLVGPYEEVKQHQQYRTKS